MTSEAEQRLTPRECAAKYGIVCPRCRGTDVESELRAEDGDLAMTVVECNECGRNWVDGFALTGHSGEQAMSKINKLTVVVDGENPTEKIENIDRIFSLKHVSSRYYDGATDVVYHVPDDQVYTLDIVAGALSHEGVLAHNIDVVEEDA